MPQSVSPDSSEKPRPASPFLAQYLDAKARYPDALLFFRMGDFYELFFEDAQKAALALSITLTKRGRHLGDDIPMAGVPVHTAEAYLAKLIRAGFKVAVCEQVEDPAERARGSKVLKREVVRVVTPGTVTEEALLDARAANALAGVVLEGDRFAMAWADISTGAFCVLTAPLARLSEELAALSPAEVLCLDGQSQSVPASGPALTPRPAVKADARSAERRLKAAFGVQTLEAFGAFVSLELSALGLVLDYVEMTQVNLAPRLEPPRRVGAQLFMAIDAATRASLEIDRTQRGEREGSLIAALDRTVTAPGSRLLAERLARPLLDLEEIEQRLDGVQYFLADSARRAQTRAALKGAPDLARALQRIVLGRAGPRDLGALREGLCAGEAARAACAGASAPVDIERACAAVALSGEGAPLGALVRELGRALADTLGGFARDGGFIADGFDEDLDAQRALRDDSRRVIAQLQARYQELTGLASLRIRHNSMFGYHIDATPKQSETLMNAAHAGTFIHRQTLASSIRFTTAELNQLDAAIASAGAKALARELELFQSFCARVSALETRLRASAHALAILDVASASAEWAHEIGAVRAQLDASTALICEAGRHPVVEQGVARQGGRFTPNDARLDGDGKAGPRLVFVTGPNMAGKSTYLRQVAVLAILAQAGLFVPAQRLRLGLVDRVFSRVGASDDLAGGRSTFMVEMVETAAILNQAGPRALVILDEIGRGTATFDGLAIAWATGEHLHDINRCRALFATHYHELTMLADRVQAGANVSLRAKEWKGELVFLHEVHPGPADRSYGIAAAKLAGLPKSAVERARAVLARLEASKGARASGLLEEMPLFAEALADAPIEPDKVRAALEQADLDAMSPRAALDLLYRLKEIAKS